MMARRKIVMLVAGLVALCGILAVGLGGCKDLTFNGDMKGYLEYWTATLGVSNPQVSEGYQMDSSGRMTISTGESVTVTATIENPDGHTVNGGVGPSSDILKSVRISGAAGDIALSSGPRVTASLTSLTLELPPLSPVPTEETRRAEHKEFTVLLAPVRTETNMSPSNPLSLTFRYNTPPRMPLAVVEDGGSFRWPRDGDRWEVSGGSICWAWPKDKTRAGGGSATDPDYVEWFYIDDGVTNKREKEAGLLQPGQTLNKDGMEYNVYKATGLAQTASVKVYAEDGDRVRGQAAVSGPIRTITLYGNGGTFGSSSTATMYVGEDSVIKVGDLETPSYTGLSLSGWSDQPSGGQSFTFPHTVSANLTLHAQWRGNSYTVTFDDGSGTGGPGSLTAAYNQTPPILPSLPTRTGYTFGGYFTKENGGGTEYYDESGTPQGTWQEPQHTTLHAQWEYQLRDSVQVLAGYSSPNHTDGTWKYVEFGYWPQTVKAADVTVDKSKSKSMGRFTYYLGSDGDWYVEAAENAYGSGTEYQYSNGEQARQGGATTKWFKVEPIVWRVLTDNYNSTGKALLLAEKVLTGGIPYYVVNSQRTIGGQTVYANNWQYSTIRAWLNGSYEGDDTQDKTYDGKGFLQTAFTSAAQNLIAATTVDNSEGSTIGTGQRSRSNPYASNTPTTDKIFLLSQKEATDSGYGFAAYKQSGTGSTRIRVTTDYAKATGAEQNSTPGYGGWWWLRSPDYGGADEACLIHESGNAFDTGLVHLTRGGVVPALCVQLPTNN